jgi:hypothetical protein
MFQVFSFALCKPSISFWNTNLFPIQTTVLFFIFTFSTTNSFHGNLKLMDSLFSHTSNSTDCAHINFGAMLLYPPLKKVRKIWSVWSLRTALFPSVIELFHADSKPFKIPAITLRTAWFNNQGLGIVSTEYIYVFRIILTTYKCIFLYSIKRLALVMETQCLQ